MRVSTMAGRYCRLVRPDVDAHAPALFEAYKQGGKPSSWTYLKMTPVATLSDMKEIVRFSVEKENFFTILDDVGTCSNQASPGVAQAVGQFSYLRDFPARRSVEIGWVMFSPRMTRSRVGTEAIYLLLKHAFEEAGYDRVEWKCDALNAKSRSAALRYGFRFEGLWRNALVYKGRNRDTAWFSILRSEWDSQEAEAGAGAGADAAPGLKHAFEEWLAPGNFAPGTGKQLRKLAVARAPDVDASELPPQTTNEFGQPIGVAVPTQASDSKASKPELAKCGVRASSDSHAALPTPTPMPNCSLVADLEVLPSDPGASAAHAGWVGFSELALPPGSAAVDACVKLNGGGAAGTGTNPDAVAEALVRVMRRVQAGGFRRVALSTPSDATDVVRVAQAASELGLVQEARFRACFPRAGAPPADELWFSLDPLPSE